MALHTDFNPRAPCGARLCTPRDSAPAIYDFNPRAPCGARRQRSNCHAGHQRISILAPRAGRDTLQLFADAGTLVFQSARPVRGATKKCQAQTKRGKISIRAPRAGRDDHKGNTKHKGKSISIRAPRAGRDRKDGREVRNPSDFNPRAPCRARPCIMDIISVLLISIRAPRAGRDLYHRQAIAARTQFQSARPVQGATPPPP